MPIPEERVYRPDRLNRWFAVSSILMTGSLVWLILSDHYRPWREFQQDYFVVKAAVAHLDYLDATRNEKEAELIEARNSLENIRTITQTEKGGEISEVETALAASRLDLKKIISDYSQQAQVLEVTRDTYEKVLAKNGEEDEKTKAALAQVEREAASVAELQVVKEKFEDEAKVLEKKLRGLHASVKAAEKAVIEIEKIREEASEKDRMYRGVLYNEGILANIPIVAGIINHTPLMDFVAPKTALGREQVHQLVLPDIRQNLNYLETYTTDRCTTCHVSIDDPDFTPKNLAKKLERGIPGINDALSRAGKDPVTPLGYVPKHPETGKAFPDGQIAKYWDILTADQQDAYFDALVDYTNEYLEKTDRKPINLGQPLLAHPDLDLYVSVDSPHPMQSMGCTVCHEGNPQETDFVQAAHSPPTKEIEEEWKEKYYVTEMGVPTITFYTVAHYWDRPMRHPIHTESGCVKCHSQVSDIATYEGESYGERINLGRQLFQQVGCINCHLDQDLKDSRRVGPDLSHMASKLSPEFAHQWINFPQKFRPSTRMPHFFQQENSLDISENDFDPHPEFRSETEVAAISHYLMAISMDWKPLEKPSDVTGDAERGKTLFASVGCQGCHTNLDLNGEAWITADLMQREGIDEEKASYRYKGMTTEERHHYAMEHFNSQIDAFLEPEQVRFEEGEYKPPVFSRFAPELSGIGSKVSFDWLYSWLIEPTHYFAETRMPSLRLSPQEAADIATYLMTLKNDDFEQVAIEMNEDRQAEVRGLMKTLLSAQRSEARSEAIIRNEGDELTNMIVSLITTDKMTEQEAYDLVSPMTLEDKQLMYFGNKMISHYGCYTCHTIAGFEEAAPVGTELTTWAQRPITQLDFAFYDTPFKYMRADQSDKYGGIYRPESDFDELRHYSPLEGDQNKEQITHTHAAFVKHKLLNPRIWDREKIKRPYDKLKMPNFYFTEEEADAITTYMMSRVSPRVNDNLRIDYEGTSAGPIARGRNLTRELNCVGCHQFEGNAPMVQQYFQREVGGKTIFDETNAPPRLWGQGAKTQPDWLHGFFAEVETLRPWLQIRMPSFNLTDQEASDLVAYFASLSQYDAENLAEIHAPIKEYIADKKSKATDAGEQTEGMGADWYHDPLLQDEGANLRGFGIERKLMRDNAFDTLNLPDSRISGNHGKLLERTEFLEHLYDIEYPFGEPPITLSDEERFTTGANLFKDMGCLKCHVMGAMLPGPAKNTDDFVQMYRLDAVRGEGDDAVAILNGEAYKIGSKIDGHTLVSAQNLYYDTGDVETTAIIEGPGPSGEVEKVQLLAASAPNLDLTYKRLRRDWFVAWMLQPGLIQPGTKMPQNFVDGVSPFEGDPAYPGDGMDHIQLLADYVYEAGVKGTRAPLDKIVLSDDDEDFDEDGDEDFDEEEFD